MNSKNGGVARTGKGNNTIQRFQLDDERLRRWDELPRKREYETIDFVRHILKNPFDPAVEKNKIPTWIISKLPHNIFVNETNKNQTTSVASAIRPVGWRPNNFRELTRALSEGWISPEMMKHEQPKINNATIASAEKTQPTTLRPEGWKPKTTRELTEALKEGWEPGSHYNGDDDRTKGRQTSITPPKYLTAKKITSEHPWEHNRETTGAEDTNNAASYQSNPQNEYDGIKAVMTAAGLGGLANSLEEKSRDELVSGFINPLGLNTVKTSSNSSSPRYNTQYIPDDVKEWVAGYGANIDYNKVWVVHEKLPGKMKEAYTNGSTIYIDTDKNKPGTDGYNAAMVEELWHVYQNQKLGRFQSIIMQKEENRRLKSYGLTGDDLYKNRLFEIQAHTVADQYERDRLKNK